MSAEKRRRHRRDRGRPRAVVFAVVPGGRGEPGEDEALAEIKELLRSADMDWVADVVQHRDTPDRRTYLGKGKMTDLKAAIAETGATVAVCEDDLTPAQVAAVLDAVDVDVLDRTELILDGLQQARALARGHAAGAPGPARVRAHAHARQGPRHRAAWAPASTCAVPARPSSRSTAASCASASRRCAGASSRWRRRAARSAPAACAPTCRSSPWPGYTNAGKSTLLNALTDADVSVRDRLFETLDPTSRTYRYRDRDYVLTDTVGFIRKLPHQLVDAFASTLEETTLADVILVVADASLEAAEIAVREQTVADVLEMIGCSAPADRRVQQDRPRGRAQLLRLRALYPEAEFISAGKGDGLDALRACGRFFDRALRPVRLLFPYAEAGEMHRLRGVASDVREEHTPEGVVFEARLPVAEAGRYARYRIEPEAPETTATRRRCRPRCAPGPERGGRPRCRRRPDRPRAPSDPGARLPERAYEGDAASDLFARRRLRSRRSPAPSSAPASPSTCRPAWRRSRCRAPAWPRGTASRSSTLPVSSTPATVARCASSS